MYLRVLTVLYNFYVTYCLNKDIIIIIKQLTKIHNVLKDSVLFNTLIDIIK